jgi:SAM-dependent methyltransferase
MYSKPQSISRRPQHALPKGLEDAWFRVLLGMREQLTEGTVNEVIAAVRSGVRPEYSKQGAAFTYLYYAANFTKVMRAMSCVAGSAPALRGSRLRVLDLGCGAGASSAAVVQWLLERRREFSMELTLVDTCDDQLELFDSLTGTWLRRFPSVMCKTYCDGAFQFLSQSRGKFDLILASYLICEVPAESMDVFLDGARHRLMVGGAAIVVDDGGRAHSASIITNVGKFAFDYPKAGLYLGKALQFGLPQMPKACISGVHVNRTNGVVKTVAVGVAQRHIVRPL